MSKTFFPIVFFAAVFVLNPFELLGQKPANVSTADMSSRVGVRPRRVLKPNLVMAELERQQKFLDDIAARYEEVSTRDLTPLLKYVYVWNALRENRIRISQPKVHLTASESRLFIQAYNVLEEQTLTSFRDQQLILLNEALELEEDQVADVQRVLTIDLNDKRRLLSNATILDVEFRNRLDKISDTTEREMLAILTPEQRDKFYRQLNFNRDRLVG